MTRYEMDEAIDAAVGDDLKAADRNTERAAFLAGMRAAAGIGGTLPILDTTILGIQELEEAIYTAISELDES